MVAEHVDVVVVGSGFGGAVAADRLAAGGRSVAVLERGRAWPPGSFPRSPREIATSLWDPGSGLHGLYHVWSFRGLEAIVSSGLGGGSLIYANVLLRKDERWFVHDEPLGDGTVEHWPVSRADLDPHYDRVERLLGATPYPYPDTAKTAAMRDAAARAGLDWDLPNLAVTFAGADGTPRPSVPVHEPDGNLHGVGRRTCRLCGECDIGCNDGSKNTLDLNALSRAQRNGASIRTGCEVRRVAPRPAGGWRVDFVAWGDDHVGVPTEAQDVGHETLTADRVVLAAGALGTTWLLLRNRANLPGLGPALGTRFSGNGDLLTLALRALDDDGRPRVLDAARGPVITSAVRVPDRVDGGDGRGHYVEDAGFPAFLEWVLEAQARPSRMAEAARFAGRWLRTRLTRHFDSDLSAEFAKLLGDTALSSTSMPLLGMGRDVADGRLTLRRGLLDVDWTTETSTELFGNIRATMRDLAEAMGAEYRDNLLWLFKRVITVHPLGGAPMGRHVGEGVVDEYGQVFGHPGLYVVDGAAMPGPVGPNPSLTIAAFADRVAERMLEVAPTSTAGARAAATATEPSVAGGATAPDAAVASEAEPPDDGAPGGAALSFTEEMKGHVTLGEVVHEEGARLGRRDGTRLSFRLTITIEDVDAFVADPARSATATGWVTCEALGGRRPVVGGEFNLFVDTERSDTTRMLYRLWFSDAVGNPLTLVGFKTVRDDPGLDTWSDTSTLYVQVLRGHVAEFPTLADVGDPVAGALALRAAGDRDVVAAGIIVIQLVDFAQQLTTFRVAGPDPAARASALTSFGRLFLGELWDAYGGRALRAAQHDEGTSPGAQHPAEEQPS